MTPNRQMLVRQGERGGYAGQCTASCVCCEAAVVVPGPGVPPFIVHRQDRLDATAPCPRSAWPVLEAIDADA